jgi:hypothetical protein
LKRRIRIYYQIEAPGTVQRRKTTNNDEAIILLLCTYPLL